MEFNLASRGRVADVKQALKDQAKAVAKANDKETAACVDVVAKAVIDHIDGEDQDRAVGVVVTVKAFEL
jgi:hypothetical protein